MLEQSNIEIRHTAQFFIHLSLSITAVISQLRRLVTLNSKYSSMQCLGPPQLFTGVNKPNFS